MLCALTKKENFCSNNSDKIQNLRASKILKIMNVEYKRGVSCLKVIKYAIAMSALLFGSNNVHIQLKLFLRTV